jgi:hypothetical protein
MHTKGFVLFPALVMIIGASGCDNVQWAGVEMELRSPPERAPAPEPVAGDEAPALTPIALEPVLYLVDRGEGSTATVLPVAQLGPGGYLALPDPDGTPDLVERFPLDRWEAGTELVLMSQGVRVGTLTLDGSHSTDETTCRLRPRTGGRIELLPEAAGQRRFLALRKGDFPETPPPGVFPGLQDSFELRAGTLNVARLLIPQVQAPWPPSIPEIRRHHTPFSLPEGGTGLAASLIYDGGLEVGEAPPLAYSLFFLAREEGGAFRPLVSWYQRVRESGKAFPRFVEAHDVRRVGTHDVLLETFGEESRWFTILGVQAGSWEVVHQDSCGLPVPRGALRQHP